MAERCRICGRGIMAAVECPKLQGPVHDFHCADCEYFEKILGICRFLEAFNDAAEMARLREQEKRKREDREREYSEGRQQFHDYIEALRLEVEDERRKRAEAKRKGL